MDPDPSLGAYGELGVEVLESGEWKSGTLACLERRRSREGWCSIRRLLRELGRLRTSEEPCICSTGECRERWYTSGEDPASDTDGVGVYNGISPDNPEGVMLLTREESW